MSAVPWWGWLTAAVAAALLAIGFTALLCALWDIGVILARSGRRRLRARQAARAAVRGGGAQAPLRDLVLHPALEDWARAVEAHAAPSDGIGDDAVAIACGLCGGGAGRCTCARPCGRAWCGAGWAA